MEEENKTHSKDSFTISEQSNKRPAQKNPLVSRILAASAALFFLAYLLSSFIFNKDDISGNIGYLVFVSICSVLLIAYSVVTVVRKNTVSRGLSIACSSIFEIFWIVYAIILGFALLLGVALIGAFQGIASSSSSIAESSSSSSSGSGTIDNLFVVVQVMIVFAIINLLRIILMAIIPFKTKKIAVLKSVFLGLSILTATCGLVASVIDIVISSKYGANIFFSLSFEQLGVSILIMATYFSYPKGIEKPQLVNDESGI
ncbi:MAG: hypothetical protein LKE31_01220 [Bacilli bacterium]|jgi:hypothetical protein|nr:hypothetical protein [Bacilli bacterium]